jgi:uncharacterized protein YaaW (UPF0174 family)
MSDNTEAQQNVLEELGLHNLDEEKQKEFLEKMNEVILKKVLLATVDKLSEEDQKHLDELIEEQAEPENIEKFLLEKIPEYNEMVHGIAREFINELKKDVIAAKN